MREELDIITAYNFMGTYRSAAPTCGTTHKDVVQRHATGGARMLRALVEAEIAARDASNDE